MFVRPGEDKPHHSVRILFGRDRPLTKIKTKQNAEEAGDIGHEGVRDGQEKRAERKHERAEDGMRAIEAEAAQDRVIQEGGRQGDGHRRESNAGIAWPEDPCEESSPDDLPPEHRGQPAVVDEVVSLSEDLGGSDG